MSGGLFCGRKSFFLLLFLLGLYFFAANVFYPLMSDDYTVWFMWDGAHGGNITGMQPGHVFEPKQSLSDVFSSVASMYMTWGGRYEGWSFTQLALFFGKPVFNVANTFFALALLSLICFLARGKEGLSGRTLFWAFVFFWLMDFGFGNTMLWLAGATVYLWPMVFELLLLALFVQEMRGGRVPRALEEGRPASLLLLFLLGLLAGNSQENAGFVTALAVSFFWYRRRKRWMFSGALGCVLGYAALALAPGNFARYAVVLGVADEYVPFGLKLRVMTLLFLHQFPALLLILPFLHRRVRQECDSPELQQECRLLLFFAAMGLLSALVLAASPSLPPRTFFGTTVFFTVAALIALRLLTEHGLRYYRPRFLFLLGALAVMLAAVTLPQNLPVERQLDAGYDRMIAVFRAHPGEDIVLPVGMHPNYSADFVDVYPGTLLIVHDYFGWYAGHVSPDPSCWSSACVSSYYHLASVRRALPGKP